MKMLYCLLHSLSLGGFQNALASLVLLQCCSSTVELLLVAVVMDTKSQYRDPTTVLTWQQT